MVIQIVTGLSLGLLISFVAWRLGSLSRSGALGAAITGSLIFGFGGFFLFISSLIIYHSVLSGVAFIISGVIWLFIILKFKGNFDGSKSP